LHGLRRKHSPYIVGKACLQRYCIATEVTRLLLTYSLPRMGLKSRCLATAFGRHVLSVHFPTKFLSEFFFSFKVHQLIFVTDDQYFLTLVLFEAYGDTEQSIFQT
jgi:hypothetical protein